MSSYTDTEKKLVYAPQILSEPEDVNTDTGATGMTNYTIIIIIIN